MKYTKVVLTGLMLSSPLFGSWEDSDHQYDSVDECIQESHHESCERDFDGGPLTADTLVKRGYTRSDGFQVMSGKTYSILFDVGRILMNMGNFILLGMRVTRLSQDTVRSAYGPGVRFGEYIRLTGVSMESISNVVPSEVGRVLRNGFIFARDRLPDSMGIKEAMQLPEVLECLTGFCKEFLDGVCRGYDKDGETI